MEEKKIERNKAYETFFTSLRGSLKNISIYSKEHPFFLKSVEDLKANIDSVLSFYNPLKIGIAPDSLLVDNEFLKEKRLYQDLAKDFHLRKIKSIEIGEGITTKELISFLTKTSLPMKEVIKKGGTANILQQEGLNNLKVESLDYSQFLGEDGEESKDIWIHLLGRAVDGGDPQQIEEFVENFEKAIGKFHVKDFLENKDLCDNVQKFFSFLEKKRKDQYNKCQKDFIHAILQDESISPDAKLDRLRALFKELSEHDFADVLWDQMAKNENFDSMSFMLFSQLADEDKHKDIASSLAKRMSKSKTLSMTPKTKQRVKELFTKSDDPNLISGIYRKTLSGLLESLSFEKERIIDLAMLETNYRSSLLNLLAFEKRQERLVVNVERILAQCQKIVSDNDVEFMEKLDKIIQKKREEIISFDRIYDSINRDILHSIESVALDQEIPPGFDFFLTPLRESTVSPDYYLTKIFVKNRIDSLIFRLFVKFYPDQLPRFYERLKEKSNNTDFLLNVIKSVEGVDSISAFEGLKKIYFVSGDLIKVEALKAMQNLPHQDEDFLFLVLGSGNTTLMKQAFLILQKAEGSEKRALEFLFPVSNPLGKNNATLLKSIDFAEEADLREAQTALLHLSKKRFLWNRKIRRRAREVLRKWHVT